MKTTIKISVLFLAVLILASSCSHRREKKELRDEMQKMQRFGMMHEMRQGNFHRGPWGGNFRKGPGMGSRGHFGPDQGMMDNPGFAPGMRGMMRMNSIPNLTDKQKKEIADLRDQNMEEIRKFRDENMSKMQSMMDEHHKKMMNILTEEQKKYLEEGKEAEPPSDKK